VGSSFVTMLLGAALLLIFHRDFIELLRGFAPAIERLLRSRKTPQLVTGALLAVAIVLAALYALTEAAEILSILLR
jgi:hypothetical protein